MKKTVYLENPETGGVIRLSGPVASSSAVGDLVREGYRIITRKAYYNALRRIDWRGETVQSHQT